MSTDQVLEVVLLATRALLYCAVPVLGALLAVAVVAGLFQSVFQLQDPVVGFVPKFIVLGLVLFLGGRLMVEQLAQTMKTIFLSLPGVH